MPNQIQANNKNNGLRDDKLKSIGDELRATTDDLKERGQEAKSLLVESGREAGSIIANTASELGSHSKKIASKAGEGIKSQTNNLRTVIADYIEEKPLTAIGIAAAVGLTLGILLKKS